MRLIPKTLYNRVRGRLVHLKGKNQVSSKILKKARIDTIGIRQAYGIKRRSKFHI